MLGNMLEHLLMKAAFCQGAGQAFQAMVKPELSTIPTRDASTVHVDCNI